MSKIFDKAIGFFSPAAEAQRIRSRIAVNSLRVLESKLEERGYEAASKKPRLSSWDFNTGSINEVNKSALSVLRGRSRDLCRNNCYAKRAKEVISTHTVGAGIYPQFKSSGPTSVAKKEVEKFEKLWNDWANSKNCDADGRTNFYGLQAIAMETIVESGEVLARKRVRRLKDGLAVPLKIQIIEPDYLDTEKSEEFLNGSKIVQGKEYNKLGELVAFHLFENHPGDYTTYNSYLNNTKRIPVKGMLDIYRAERPGQVRGIPWGSSILVRLKDLDEFEDAALMQQKIAACFSAFLRKPISADDEDSEFENIDEDDNPVRKMSPGIVQSLPEGWDISFGQPPTPTAAGEYTREQKMAIAVGFGTTYESVTGDYSKSNFSSSRMGRIDFLPNYKKWQAQMIIPQFCQPALEWFFEACELAGHDTSRISASWITPKVEPIDPLKEANARQKDIRNGIRTLSEVIREDSRDPGDVFESREKELKILDEKGIVTDTDPRRTSLQGGSQKKEEVDSE